MIAAWLVEIKLAQNATSWHRRRRDRI